MPWNGSEYYGLYDELLRIIDEVDPALVVLDPQFGPALDATKNRNRKHAVVSPNSLRDNFAQIQPYGVCCFSPFCGYVLLSLQCLER